MDTSESLLRAFAFRLALLVLAVFIARTFPDNRPTMDRTVTVAPDCRSLGPGSDSATMSDMASHD